MKKRIKKVSLGRKSSQRRALVRTLLVSLIEQRTIKTTLPKAKMLRPWAERMLTKAKRGVVSPEKKVAMLRNLTRDLPEKSAFELMEIAKKYTQRAGGYLRIIKLGNRKSDTAPMALVQWVGAMGKKSTTEKKSQEEKEDKGKKSKSDKHESKK